MLHEDIQVSLKEALKNKDDVAVRTIRNMLTAFTNELVASKRTPQDKLSDKEVAAVIKRLAKQRQESIVQFQGAGRDDLVKPEQAELTFLEGYLPKPLDRAAIKLVAEAKKTELGIEDKNKQGLLIGAVMKELDGQADGSDVKAVVKSLF